MPTIDHSIELNKRLGVVIALLLRSLPKPGEGLSLRDQVCLLSELGMRPKDIADILGRTPTYVSKELTTIRKNKKKKTTK
jgi:DNA-binding CsgD family transcriptional regulator